MTLNAIWFILIFVLLGGYAVLDGFDFGVGALYLLTRDDDQRRIYLNAIGPLWDGNEVWLLTGGGALFAAFPAVYATVFSGFYLALMLVLTGLIFRATSIEFRGKVNHPRWRRIWDLAFSLSSIVLPVLLGVALGNVLRGVPITADRYYGGTFFDLLNPYAVLVGVLALLCCVMHGAVFLLPKVDDQSRPRLVKLALRAYVAVIALFIVVSVGTFNWAPSLVHMNAAAIAALAILVLAAALLAPLLKKGKYFPALAASSAMILAMMALAGIGLFPRLLPALNDPAASLTIYNASSSPLTLKVMLIIALLGMPLVIGYTAVIHYIFRGKVVLHENSY